MKLDYLVIFNFLLNIIYIVERGACGPWLGGKGRGVEEDGTNILLLFTSCLLLCAFLGARRREGGHSLLSNCISTRGWGWSFDNVLENLVWEIMFQGWYLSCFVSSVKLLALQRWGWENLCKVCWLTKSTLVHPLAQALAAKCGQESCPSCSDFYPQMRHLTPSAGLDMLAVRCPVCIRACYPQHKH